MRRRLPFLLDYSLHAFASDGSKMWLVEYGQGSEQLSSDQRRTVTEKARKIKKSLLVTV